MHQYAQTHLAPWALWSIKQFLFLTATACRLFGGREKFLIKKSQVRHVELPLTVWNNRNTLLLVLIRSWVAYILGRQLQAASRLVQRTLHLSPGANDIHELERKGKKEDFWKLKYFFALFQTIFGCFHVKIEASKVSPKSSRVFLYVNDVCLYLLALSIVMLCVYSLC